MTEAINEPSTADLAKAVWELSVLIGVLPSKTEREYITMAAARLITPWLENNVSPDQLDQWFNTDGPISRASKLGQAMHYRHD